MKHFLLFCIFATLALSFPEICSANEQNTSPLFSSHQPISFTIEAPFESLFKDKNKQYVVGTVRVGQTNLQAQVRVRGQLSLEICEFPKLKIKLSRREARGTVFEGNEQFEIGTHCKSDLSDAGMAHPFREALVYRWLQIGGFISYSARPAIITYIEPGKSQTTQNAFVLESMDSLLDRTGAVEARTHDQEGIQNSKKANDRLMFDFLGISDPNLIQSSWELTQVFERITGNMDFVISCLHNLKALRLQAGPIIIFPIDFNLSSLVSGQEFDENIFADINSVDSQRRIAKSLLAKQSEFYNSLSELGDDPSGRQVANGVLDRAFQYSRVVLADHQQSRLSSKTGAVCVGAGVNCQGVPCCAPLSCSYNGNEYTCGGI